MNCASCVFYFVDPSFGPECSALLRHVLPSYICEGYAPIQQSKDCSTCEFYCVTPPNDGRCNVTGNYTSAASRCDQYTRLINRNPAIIQYEPYMTYDQLIDDFKISNANKICFSCGSPIRISTRGRRKYCAVCGCYLPEILYNDHFGDANEMVNPMEIPRPKPLPTVNTH